MRSLSSVLLLLVVAAIGCNTPAASTPDAGSDAAFPPDAHVDPHVDAAVADAGSIEDAGSLDDAHVDDDAGQDAGPRADAGPLSPELVEMYDTVLAVRCGGPMCHGPGTNESVYFGYAPRLQWTDAASARDALVDRPLDCIYIDATDWIRVVPGDPAASAILWARGDGLCARRHNIVVPDMTDEEMAVIERWIVAGAH